MDRECSEIRKRMADRLNGARSEEAEGAIRRHVEVCFACRAYEAELLGDDELLSAWADCEQEEMAGELERVIRPLTASHSGKTGGSGVQRAMAAGFLIAVGFAGGLLSSFVFSRGDGQEAPLSRQARAALVEDVLAQVRGEIEGSKAGIQQELRTELAAHVEKAAADLNVVLDRDREWLMTTLNTMQERHRTESAAVHEDLARLARVTEAEIARTRQGMADGTYSNSGAGQSGEAGGRLSSGSKL